MPICRIHQIEPFGVERCQSAGYIKSSLLGQKDANLQDTSNRRKMPICRIHQIELFGVERCQSVGYIKSSFLGWKNAKLQDTSNRAFWGGKMPICRINEIFSFCLLFLFCIKHIYIYLLKPSRVNKFCGLTKKLLVNKKTFIG